MNKKSQAGNQITIFAFLLLLIVLGTGIAIGNYAFFGADYDYRKSDASALNIKIKNCLEDGKLNFNSQEETDASLEKDCQINSTIIKNYFIIAIEKNQNEIYKSGDATLCQLASKNKEFPKCVNSTVFLPDEKLTIITGSYQNKRGVII